MAETSKRASSSRLAWCGRLILYSTPVATCLLVAVSLYNFYELSQHERKLLYLQQHVFHHHHHRRDFRDMHDATEPEDSQRRHARALSNEESSASLFEEYFTKIAELQVVSLISSDQPIALAYYVVCTASFTRDNLRKQRETLHSR